MVDNRPPRTRLADLIRRSGKSQTYLAKELGYSYTSGFNRYFSADKQGDRPIPYDIVSRLIPHLRGAGSPPITLEELLACTDVKEIPKPVVRAFTSIVDDGDGLVAVKYRIEAGTYVRRDNSRMYGASRIGMAKDYPAADQFVVVIADDDSEAGPRGTQLHCVRPRDVIDLVGSRVVCGSMRDDLMEVRLGLVTGLDDTNTPIIDCGGPTGAVVLGRVIGVYKRE